jgi:hypothetical protein
MSALSGARTIKRQRRTKAAVEQLEQQILDALKEDHPQSIRHVFYRLTDPRLPEPVDKTELGYRVVQNRLTVMRRQGRVRYGCISDATRRGYHTLTYSNGADFLRRHIGAYRADLWAVADAYVEVWCESRSIAGSIVDLCEELAVSLYPAGGFASITVAYEAADFIRQEVEDGKQAHIIYIGDYDPAGVLIDRSLEAEMRRHLDPPGLDGFLDLIAAGADPLDIPGDQLNVFVDRLANGRVELSFHRLAITEEQIIAYDLPTKPRKETDRRAQHVKETVEAEAMPAGILRALLRDAVEVYLPEGALEVARVAEQSERAQLRRWADLMAGDAHDRDRAPRPRPAARRSLAAVFARRAGRRLERQRALYVLLRWLAP